MNVFSDLATIECLKKDIYNVSIYIKAIPCDNIIECKNDEDERFCTLDNYIPYVIFVGILTIHGFLAYVMWNSTINGLDIIQKDMTISDEEMELLHATDKIRTLMFQAQNYEHFQKINSRFVEMEMKIHHENLSEVICCIKVSTY